MQKNNLMYFILSKRAKSILAILLILSSISIESVIAANDTSKIILQQQEFKGTVYDESGVELPGVAIMKKGTNEGTVTDFDGNFSILAKKGDVFSFSYVGYEDQIFIYGAQENIKIILKEDTENLEEVVVIGYGKITKKEVTGAVSQVKGKDLVRQVTPSVEQALQGQVAGVNVTAAGAPGDDAIIEIRGVGSLTGEGSPLYVVDGVVQQEIPRLNSHEIESVDILKDAASAAIYGVQGGNGVILITTKQAKPGKAKIDFNYSSGIQRIISNGTELLNSNEQLYTRIIAENNGSPLFNLNLENGLRNETFDIRDIIVQDDALQSSYNLTLSGGTPEISYNLTGGYFEQDGAIVNTNFKRHNIRASTILNKGRLKVRTSVAYRQENSKRPRWNILPQSLVFAPYNNPISLSDEIVEANEGDSFLTQNFLAAIQETNKLNRNIINLSTNVDFELAQGLKLNSVLGYFNRSERGLRFVPQFSVISQGEVETEPLNSLIRNTSSIQDSYNIDNTLHWDKRFGKHRFRLLAGVSLQKQSSEYFEASRRGVLNNNIQVLNIGSVQEQAASGTGGRQNLSNTRIGTLARLQYDFKKKYLLSATIRRDASDVFRGENIWGTFPSVSIGWNIASEKFWKPLKSIVNNFKLRASIAESGNDRLGRQFNYIADQNILTNRGATFGRGDQQIVGFIPTQASNPELKWETTIQSNFGVDLGFFKNKFNISAEYYLDEKQDLLLPIRLPTAFGTDNLDVIANIGSLENKGIEIELKHRNKIGELNYSIGATYTQNENRITKLNGQTERIVNSQTLINGDATSTVSQLRVGKPASAFFLFKTDGVIKTDEELAQYTAQIPEIVTGIAVQKGDLKYVDVNEDGVIDDDDRVFSGSGLPDYTVGLNMNLDYKGFDFNMNWYASVGNDIVNGPKALAYNRLRHRDLLNQWTVDNPLSNIPAYRGDSKRHPNSAGTTDLWIEDGSFIRLKQIALGYTIDPDTTRKLGIERFRISLSAQNILTFTDYTGFDPEITNPTGGNNIANRGVDIGNYPITGQYLLGIELNF